MSRKPSPLKYRVNTRRLIVSAARMVMDFDRKRGADPKLVQAYYLDYITDLRPFVQAEIDKQTPAIHIPRRASAAYIKSVMTEEI